MNKLSIELLVTLKIKYLGGKTQTVCARLTQVVCSLYIYFNFVSNLLSGLIKFERIFLVSNSLRKILLFLLE